MGRVRGSQTDLASPSSGIKQLADFRYALEIDPSGGLQVGALGLKVKSGGILSAMIAAGAILGAHVGFTDNDVPNTSGLPGASVKDALDSVSGSFADFLKHDGTVPMSGDLNLGGFKIVSMAQATNPNEAVTLLQLQQAIQLQNQQLFSCAYAGVGAAGGALRLSGSTPFVRASQTVFLAANPVNGDTISFAGATLTFVSPGPAGPNQVLIGISAAVTAANLVAAFNSSMALTTPWGTGLMNAAYAIRESTGVGQTVHVVWKDDDLPVRTPSDANTQPGYGCATSNPLAVKFVVTDPGTGTPRFYGAYDSVKDGATVQARYENGIYTYNEDQGAWILTFANPGSGFFGGVIGDLGGLQVAGPNATLLVEGSTTIQTVSGFFTGPKVTLTHKDASALLTPFHSDASVILRTNYPNVGTNIGDTQADFNGAADELLGDLRGAALRNVLVNGTFIDDPVGGSPYASAPAGTVPVMPGWALRDNAAAPGNTASVTWDAAPPAPPVGPSVARIDITLLTALVKHFDFYQPILSPHLYSGRQITFRAAVYASTGVKIFINTSTGYTWGDTHPGDGAWHDLEVSMTLADPESLIEVGIESAAGSLDTIYVDAATCVIGAALTGLPFIARDEVEDRAAIAAYYHKFTYKHMVWAQPVGPAFVVYVTIPFPSAMVAVPTVNVAFTPGAPAPAVPALAGPPSVSDRAVTLDVIDTSGASWGPPVALPDAFIADVELDARPT